MIIDLILDRRDGIKYNAREFYWNCMQYGNIGITEAMDYGTELDVKAALCRYIKENEYNLDICKYINSNKWL